MQRVSNQQEEQVRRQILSDKLRILLGNEIPKSQPNRAALIDELVNDALIRGIQPKTGKGDLDRKIANIMQEAQNEAVAKSGSCRMSSAGKS